MRVGAALIGLPAELVDDAFEDAVGVAQVPGIVKAPDNEMVLFDIREFLRLHGIVAEDGHVIGMVVKGGLMSDDQVFVVGDCSLENLVCVEESGGDAGDDSVGVASFDRVYCSGWRGCAGGGNDFPNGGFGCQRSVCCLRVQRKVYRRDCKQQGYKCFLHDHSVRSASM